RRGTVLAAVRHRHRERRRVRRRLGEPSRPDVRVPEGEPLKGRWLALLLAAVVLATRSAPGQVMVTSPTNKHNLSRSGPGPVKSTAMTEICIFCHTPHNANPAAPLWNQTLSGVTYTPYTSTTMVATAGVPSGSSKLCLSCHDGTVAIGSTMSGRQIPMQGLTGGKLTGPSSLGLNLSDDHPIAFVPVTGSQIVNPALGSAVKLDKNGQIQCRTCHDPHQMDIDPTAKKFLAASNSASALCVTCHRQQYWAANPSTHMTSTKAYTLTQGAHTGYATVATNGCESCHKPHTAPEAARGLKAPEELTCGGTGSQCHGTTAVGRDIQSEFLKAYAHPTYSVTPSVHDASESPTNSSHMLPEISAATPRHAECADCHDNDTGPNAPTPGTGPSGPHGSSFKHLLVARYDMDNQNTAESADTYALCYKCHDRSIILGIASFKEHLRHILLDNASCSIC